jgi:hypothetical protein
MGSTCTPTPLTVGSDGSVDVCAITNITPPDLSSEDSDIVSSVCTFQQSVQNWHGNDGSTLYHGFLGTVAYAMKVNGSVKVLNPSAVTGSGYVIPTSAPGAPSYSSACSNAMKDYDSKLGALASAQAKVNSATGQEIEFAKEAYAAPEADAASAKAGIVSACFPESDISTSTYTGAGKRAYEMRRGASGGHVTCELENYAGYLLCRTLLPSQLASDIEVYNAHCAGGDTVDANMSDFREKLFNQRTSKSSYGGFVDACTTLASTMIEVSDEYTRMWKNPAISSSGATFFSRCDNLAHTGTCGALVTDIQKNAEPAPSSKPSSAAIQIAAIGAAEAACIESQDATILQLACARFDPKSTTEACQGNASSLCNAGGGWGDGF